MGEAWLEQAILHEAAALEGGGDQAGPLRADAHHPAGPHHPGDEAGRRCREADPGDV